MLDPRLLSTMAELGLSPGAVGTGEAGRSGRPRREVPIPQRFYPHQGELLQHYGKQLAGGSSRMAGMFTEALTGIVEGNDYEELFGVSRAPLGNKVDPFFRVKVQRDMPFELSGIYPAFDDPKLTTEFNTRVQKILTSTKYPAVASEIQQASRLINQMGEPFHVVLNMGLAEGPRFSAPYVRPALSAALLLEGAATYPDTAAMSVQGRGSRTKAQVPTGELARSRRIEQRMSQLAVVQAKGAKIQGPLLADAIKMFIDRLGPSVGLRRGRDVASVPLMPMPSRDIPAMATTTKTAMKDVGAAHSFDLRRLRSQEFMQLTDDQKLAKFMGVLGERLSPVEIRNLVNEAEVNPKSPPLKVMERLSRQLAIDHGDEARQQVLMDVAGSRQAMQEVKGPGPSKTRLTTTAVAEKVIPEREVLAQMRKTEKRLGIKAKNPLAVLALASVLASAFAAMNPPSEAA